MCRNVVSTTQQLRKLYWLLQQDNAFFRGE